MSNKKNISCPACGSFDYELIKNINSEQAPFGPQIEEEEITYKCNICDSDFDYYDVIEQQKESALEISKKISIEKMLDFLSKKGYSLAAIERALELPQRTISRWKSNKDLSSVGIALLRIIRTYPWILEVAENKFNERAAFEIYMKNAITEFMKMAEGLEWGFSHFFVNGDQAQFSQMTSDKKNIASISYTEKAIAINIVETGSSFKNILPNQGV